MNRRPHMRWNAQAAGLLAATLLAAALAGCGGNAPRETAPPDNTDYREMLDRARKRREVRDNLEMLNEAVRRCQVDLARFPTSLHELVDLGYLDEVPSAPPDRVFVYDPAFGGVEIVPVPEPPAKRSAPRESE